LRPDEGIGGDGAQRVIVAREQRTESDEVAAKDRLEVKGHGDRRPT